MPRLEFKLTEHTCLCECDFCGEKYTVTKLEEFRKIIQSPITYCDRCSCYLATIRTNNLGAKQQIYKEQRELWSKLRKFQMISTGSLTLDDELRELFGNWELEPKPIWGK